MTSKIDKPMVQFLLPWVVAGVIVLAAFYSMAKQQQQIVSAYQAWADERAENIVLKAKVKEFDKHIATVKEALQKNRRAVDNMKKVVATHCPKIRV